MRCTAHRSRPRPRCRRGTYSFVAAARAEPSLVAVQHTRMRMYAYGGQCTGLAAACRRYDEQRVPPTDGAPRNGEEVCAHMYTRMRVCECVSVSVCVCLCLSECLCVYVCVSVFVSVATGIHSYTSI